MHTMTTADAEQFATEMTRSALHAARDFLKRELNDLESRIARFEEADKLSSKEDAVLWAIRGLTGIPGSSDITSLVRAHSLLIVANEMARAAKQKSGPLAA